MTSRRVQRLGAGTWSDCTGGNGKERPAKRRGKKTGNEKDRRDDELLMQWNVKVKENVVGSDVVRSGVRGVTLPASQSNWRCRSSAANREC